jgi:nicotinamide-nucleotide amidase
MPSVVSLTEKLSAFSDHWSPKIVARFNENDVMVVKIRGEFVWHSHAETDDFFLVLKGSLTIQLRDGEVRLGPRGSLRRAKRRRAQAGCRRGDAPSAHRASRDAEHRRCGDRGGERSDLANEGHMRIEIICTGDEVLTGKIVNTNFSYMAQKLEDFGLSVSWGTIVGDDREELLAAFRLSSERADAVIVNGGLGPTVDDLSQEIAARAAGVELVLNEDWLQRMEDFFRRRNRVMSPNNRKQAMLPTTAEILDNPIGTACGFALDIGKARFFFTPGVPRELHRMLEEQIIPRLLSRSGTQMAIYLKRFHSYGLGESHVDQLLAGVEELVSDGSVKLGFRTHYPQIETKLTARGADMDDIHAKLAPVQDEVRKRLGNFILGEDDQTLEGVVLAGLAARSGSLTIVETFTAGQIAARIAHLPGAEKVFRRSLVARDPAEIAVALGLDGGLIAGELSREAAEAVASAARQETGASHALAVLIEIDDGPDRIDFGGSIHLAIAAAEGVESRRSRIYGGRDWVRLGAVELGLDCLRRYLQGLPVTERTDFERV